MAGQRDKIHEDVRFRILRLLEENPELSQRELADAVGVSTGSANYMLKALIEKGFVKLGNFKAAEDKRRYAYLLTPKGVAEKAAITQQFLARKMAEFEALKLEIEKLILQGASEYPKNENPLDTDQYEDPNFKLDAESHCQGNLKV